MSIVRKVFTGQIKSVDEENFTVEAVISDETVDRYNDVILVDAWKKGLKNYKKHPVLVSSHNYSQLKAQIGVAEKVWIDEENRQLMAKFKYFVGEGNEEADWGFTLAKKGVAAFSVGFIAKDYTFDKEAIAELIGNKKDLPDRLFTDVELLEVSQVLIPANPSALAKSIEADEEDPAIKCVCKQLLSKIEDGEIEIEEEFRGVVPYKKYPLMDKGKRWRGRDAERRLRKWASSDGSDSKDSMDWAKYRKGFLWYDEENADNFTAYKAPHHDIEDGEIKTHWRGTVAAMVALLGGRGGLDIPDSDRKRAYNHLARHYRDFDEEPPEFKEYETVEDVITGCKDVTTACLMLEEMFEEREAELIKSLIDHGVDHAYRGYVGHLIEKQFNEIKEFIENAFKNMQNDDTVQQDTYVEKMFSKLDEIEKLVNPKEA